VCAVDQTPLVAKQGEGKEKGARLPAIRLVSLHVLLVKHLQWQDNEIGKMESARRRLLMSTADFLPKVIG